MLSAHVAENSRQGFRPKNLGLHQGRARAKSRTALGLRGVVRKKCIGQSYRARYYDVTTGRFLSEDPIGTSGYRNLYLYGSDNPVNRNDPFGLRDILVVIWNRDLTNGSVGHAMALEMDGTVILSQFPECGCRKGKNETLDWSHSRAKEGRDPDRIFIVHVPNDDSFDKTAQNHRNRPTWDWLPTNKNQTNCVYAVDMSLEAGGVPVSDNDWPGNLGDELDKLRQKHTPKDPWNVQNGHLPNMNGK